MALEDALVLTRTLATRTSCPRLLVWEEATERRLVETGSANDGCLVRATPAGLALLKATDPSPKIAKRRPARTPKFRWFRAPANPFL
jgi:hypothetical protein